MNDIRLYTYRDLLIKWHRSGLELEGQENRAEGKGNGREALGKMLSRKRLSKRWILRYACNSND